MADLDSARRPVLRSAHCHYPTGCSFSSRDVVLHLVGDPIDPDHGPDRWHDDGVGMHQDCDGPLHLVIGRQATDAALQRAALRAGVDLVDLRNFREVQAQGAHHG